MRIGKTSQQWFGALVATVLLVACAGQDSSGGDVATYVVALDESFEPDPFTQVVGVVPWDDGTSIVADMVEGGLIPLDSQGARGQPIGGEGQGPGEFMTITEMLPQDGATFAVVDGQQRRVIVFSKDGEFLEQRMYPSEVHASPRRMTSDRLITRPGPRSDGITKVPLIAWQWDEDQVDTLALLRHPPIHLVVAGGDVPFEVWDAEPYAPEDGWTATAEGDVLLVRAEPYRVELYGEGEWVEGPVLDHPSVRVTSEDRERIEERLSSDEVPWNWPEMKPAFRPGGIWADPEEDELWVKLWEIRNGEAVYDRINFEGERVGQILIPAELEVVAVQGGVVHLTEEDEVGFQWLRRGVLEPVEDRS